MAKNKASKKTTGITLIIIGAGISIWAYQKSRGIGSQLSNAFTGSFTDNVMALFIIGAACIGTGIYLYKK